MPDINQKTPPKREIPVWFTYGALGILFMALGVTAVFTTRQNSKDFPGNAITLITNGFIRLDTETSRYIIRSTVPILEKNAGEDDPFILIHLNWSDIYWRLAANIRNTNPQEILKAQFPIMAFMKPRPIPIQPSKPLLPAIPEPVETPPPQETPPVLTTVPEILIYHTHTSESYIPVSGKDHQFNQKGDITLVGEHLQQVLKEKYGLNCLYSKDIHDQYPFRDSYKRSQVTVLKYLKEYPNLKVVLDVHRDATPGIEATCSIKGEKTATILIVVGSDKMGLPHPNWRKNLEFATKLTENMNLYYPGLSNGIVISDARYNQHLNDHALIIEFGDQNSSLEEAYRAAERFAEILALTLRKENGRQ